MDAIQRIVRVKTTNVFFFSFCMNGVRFFVFVFVVYTCVVFYRNRPFPHLSTHVVIVGQRKMFKQISPPSSPSQQFWKARETFFKVFSIGNLIHSPCAAAEVVGTRYCFLICRTNGNNSRRYHTHTRTCRRNCRSTGTCVGYENYLKTRFAQKQHFCFRSAVVRFSWQGNDCDFFCLFTYISILMEPTNAVSCRMVVVKTKWFWTFLRCRRFLLALRWTQNEKRGAQSNLPRPKNPDFSSRTDVCVH